MDIFSELINSDSFNPTGKSISSKVRKMRISWFKKSFSRRSKKNSNVGKTFPFSKNLLKLFMFCIKNLREILLFHINNLHGSFPFGFDTVFGNFNAFYYYITTSKKKITKNTIIIYKQVLKKINHKADQNAHKVKKNYYLVRRYTFFQNGRGWLFYN